MMTDPRKLQYAKMYIESLSKGINPFDGTPVPEKDVAKDARLLRCFAYVADLLAQVETMNGNDDREGIPKRPFFLTPEQKQRFVPTSTPTSLTEVVKQMNNLADLQMCQKLSRRHVFEWLVRNGYLEQVTKVIGDHSSTGRIATEKGRSIGLTRVQKAYESGTYDIELFDGNAQLFLLENINEIAASRAAGTAGMQTGGQQGYAGPAVKFENQGLRWDPKQEEMLSSLYRSGKTIGEISSIMQRSANGIRARLVRLGLMDKAAY